MIPLPRMSDVAPYRWTGYVVLLPEDVQQMLVLLPTDSRLSDLLRDAARVAAQLALRLNEADGVHNHRGNGR